MKSEKFWIITILTLLTGLFFYKTVLYRAIPFPGDILASDFQPWRSASYAGYAPGGIPNKAQYPDVIRQMYPWKTLVIEALKHGRLPLWNPFNFSGAPLLANFQSAALYPLNVVYLFMSQPYAWTLLIMLQVILAVLFTYLYTKEIGMNVWGRWLAAISYGCSGFMAVWLEYNTVGHVILWLPFILLAIEKLRSSPRPVWLGLLAVAHASALLAGHPQVYAYMTAYTLIYTYMRTKKPMQAYITGFTALGIGIAGIQIIPGAELIANAARSPHRIDTLFNTILIRPWQLWAIAFPNLFGNPATRTYWPSDTFVGKVTTIGLVPLFFSFSALRRRDRLTRWYAAAGIVIAILITANPITGLIYRIPIPLVSSSSPTLMTFLLTFSLAVFCGLGLDEWLTEPHSVRKLIRRTVQVGILFGILLIATRLPVTPELSQHSRIALRALLYGGLVAAATLALFWVAIRLPAYRPHAVTALLLVHTLDLFIFFNRFNPFVPAALIFPDHPILTYLRKKSPDRFWGYGTAHIDANFASQYRIFSPEGYDPLYPRWYGETLYSYRDGKPMRTFDDATRSDAAISSNFGDGGLSDTKKQNVLNALSVRYILDRSENASDETVFPGDIFTRVYTHNDWTVYENLHASPRVYLTSGTAAIRVYEPEEITVRTESTAAATLTLTDTWYPGWNATIDGKPATITKTAWSLRAIDVPAGSHTVSMRYKPKSVTWGAILSIMSIVTAIASLGWIHRKPYA